MASGLRKYKYDGPSSTRPSAATVKVPDKADHKSTLQEAPPEATDTATVSMDVTRIKTDILEPLRKDIASIIKEEIKNALADDFATLRKEIQDVKMEINNNTAAIRAEVDQVKANVVAVEKGLSDWCDQVAEMQGRVITFEAQVATLNEKCEDMEGRMRRIGLGIVGVPELPGSSAPDAISQLLKEVFQMEKEV